MIEILIQKEYDQTVPFTYKTSFFTIRLYSWSGFIMVDIKADDKYVAAGVLSTNNTDIVQGRGKMKGNFRLVNTSSDENYPNVNGLGDKYKLYYITPEEMEE